MRGYHKGKPVPFGTEYCWMCDEFKNFSGFYEFQPVGQYKWPREKKGRCQDCQLELLMLEALVKADASTKRDRLAQIKRYFGCVDCKKTADPDSLEFDHLPGKGKVGNVSQLSWKNAVSELIKCQVVCSGCHRKRTRKRATTKGTVN